MTNVIAFPVNKERSHQGAPRNDMLEQVAKLRRQIIDGDVTGFVAIPIYGKEAPHKCSIRVAGVAGQSTEFALTALLAAQCRLAGC